MSRTLEDSKEYFQDICDQFLIPSTKFQEAYDIVKTLEGKRLIGENIDRKRVNFGEIYLTGGSLYRPLALFRENPPKSQEEFDETFNALDVDLDFVVGRLGIFQDNQSTDFKITGNRWVEGGLFYRDVIIRGEKAEYYQGGKKTIDVCGLRQFIPRGRHAFSHGVGPGQDLKNYLFGASLSIQSIAYDLRTNQLVGDIGIGSIGRGEVEINHKGYLKQSAENRKIGQRAYVENRTNGLNLNFSSELEDHLTREEKLEKLRTKKKQTRKEEEQEYNKLSSRVWRFLGKERYW